MAQFNLLITVPDAQVPRMVAALRKHWGQIEDPVGQNPRVFRDRTQAELIELLRNSVVSSIRDIVKRVEADAATQTAVSSVTDISAT